MKRRGLPAIVTLFLFLFLSCSREPESSIVERVGLNRGICAVLGDQSAEAALQLARGTDLLVYVQLERAEEVEAARRAVDAEGFYGNRIWVDKGDFTKVHLGDNLADVLVALGEAAKEISEAEALRVVCPRGKAIIGRRTLVKPVPEGVDDWSHPYHGPDNNPQSEDKVARAPYLTQFLAEPYYAPLTQVAVASAGRMFKAFGNIAFHVREEPLLNSLVAFNGYNGTMLWRRRLPPGVMIHRNTMIATPDILYVGDDKSCKRIDTATGRLLDEIIPPLDAAGGTFWKWMALEDGVLYALIGEQEQKDAVTRQRREVPGWPWNPLSLGFNQPDNPWGFGRNLLAIDPDSERVLWSHHEEEKIDSRALCMKNGRIYIYRHGSYLASLNAKTGETLWRQTLENAPELFEALGPYLPRQGARTNWRTTAYMKSSDKALYFAGPTIGKLLAVSAEDGTVLWEHPYDNFQLVLRDDGLYGISGYSDEHPSLKFDPLNGEVLATLDTRRRSCTRPNGSVDAIFYRALGGSVRLDLTSQTQQWISPMRPQCHDGVTIANGLLYWWPSTCDCQNTLYGLTSLGPAGDFDFSKRAIESERLEVGSGDIANIANFPESTGDWPAFRANNLGTATTEAVISRKSTRLWWINPNAPFTPTAPVTAGGLVFLGGSDGIVRALDVRTGSTRWKAYTGGAVRFPPTVANGRVFVGSGDGWVYVFEAATGRLLWRFNAAPANRKIPVYGSLMSTWPVASGVLVEDGVAYLAAGIVNYDGIHVYALDAETGRIVWQNNTSGHLDAEARTGASVQGHLLIHDGKLYLAGGTSISPAVYDLKDGRCLNDPAPLKLCRSTSVRGQELYKVGNKIVVSGKPMYAHPEHPVYGATVTNKMLHTAAHDRDIVWINSRRIMCFRSIDSNVLDKLVAERPVGPTVRLGGPGRSGLPARPLWEHQSDGSVAFARCKNAVLFAGARPAGTSSIVAVDIKSGQRLWKRPLQLQSSPVPWGMAVDRDGRIIATLTDGQVMCFGPTS
jgi:outer membrane protein assembly factor BamB